jgi:hypothetical protein
LTNRPTAFEAAQLIKPPAPRGVSDSGWTKTVSALNDANVAVNTVDADGLGGPVRLWGNGAILMMQQIAEQTGGQAFFHRNDLDAAIAEGVRNSRSSYTLGFYLGDLDGNYHELRVHVDRPGLELNYRRGYYAQTDAMRDLAASKMELESALLSPLDLTGVSIMAGIEQKADALLVHVKLSAESFTLARDAGVWTGRVEALFLERNATWRASSRLPNSDSDPLGKQTLTTVASFLPNRCATFREPRKCSSSYVTLQAVARVLSLFP